MERFNPNMIRKINLHNSFGRLEWSFIRESMDFFNFPFNSKLIMSCFMTSTIPILINGIKVFYFQPFKELSKGTQSNPTSSWCSYKKYLDILTSVAGSIMSLINICKAGPRISNLFFMTSLFSHRKTHKDTKI